MNPHSRRRATESSVRETAAAAISAAGEPGKYFRVVTPDPLSRRLTGAPVWRPWELQPPALVPTDRGGSRNDVQGTRVTT